MTADLYALYTILAFAVWLLSGRHLYDLWRGGNAKGRVFCAVLGIHLTAFAAWTNRAWFTLYRQLDAPGWMLDHWGVNAGLLVGLAGYTLHAALYRPREVWRSGGLILLLSVGWLIIR